MIAPLVASALLFWALVFAVFFWSQGSSPTDYLFGPLENPPVDLGLWREVALEARGQFLEGLSQGAPALEGDVFDERALKNFDSSDLAFEERVLFPPGRDGGSVLLYQRRIRQRLSGDVVHVLPERRVKRRRHKKH